MRYLTYYIIIFIGCITFIVSSNTHYSKDHWKSYIQSDGSGYYAYLPAIFIYKDLQFSFFEKINSLSYVHEQQDFRTHYNGRIIDKYYCGTAVAMSPFFLLAHWTTLLTDGPADGYSKLYCISINIAALFYFLASLFFLARLLRLYHISETAISFTLLIFGFGTNLFYYVISEPYMSHMYSLFFITIFVYYAKLWFTKPQYKYLIFLSIALGMISLIRPINIIILAALPFIAGNSTTLLNGFSDLWKHKITLTLSAITFILICSLQLIIYKVQTGDYIVYSYTTEGFNWSKPQIFNVLLSYRKGLFVYTPITFLSLIGLIWFYKKNKFEFITLSLFLLLLLFVISSWWCWWYGGSFGMRALLEFYPFFIILFAGAFHFINNTYIKRLFVSLSVILLLVCQIQTYQMRYYYIHWSEMTKEQYWRVFLRLDWVIQGTNKQNTDLPTTLD